MLEALVRGHIEPVWIAVPLDPRLLGPSLGGADLEDGLAEVAELLASRAKARALEAAHREEQALAGVFGEEAAPSDRIEARAVEPPIEDALAELAGRIGARRCLVARDVLDIFGEVGIGLGSALDARGVDVRTR